MQGADAEVPGFGEGDCRLHGFRIPDFADEDDVRRLPQRVLQRVLKRERVEADLPLSDERLFVIMDEFDRIFHRDDVALMDRIAMVDHGGERRGFS